MDKPRFNIWDGMYSSFKDVKSDANAFNSGKWVHKSIDLLERAYKGEDFEKDRFILYDILSSLSEKMINAPVIVDFGGGVGITYARLRNKIRNNQFVYHIIENEAVCSAGSDFFQNKESCQVFFHNTFPAINKVNVAYIQSSLQYVDDWMSVIEKLISYNPDYFIFVDTPAGDISSFVTAQNFYGMRIPYRFFNLDEIKSVLFRFGYSIVNESHFDSIILEKNIPLPMHNFPEIHRIKHSVDLVFKRS